jgi:hypothetical protein
MQCLTILHSYEISIVTYKELDVSKYLRVAQIANKKIGFEYFDNSFFKDAASYNRMLMSREFYSRFEEDDYILVYQTDAFVFRDELSEWCAKGYEYIGAPWFTRYGTHEKGNRLYKVGNGGVSLRKVSSFLDRFDKRMPFSVFPFYVKNIRKKGFVAMCFKTLWLGFLLIFTSRTVEYYLQHHTDRRIPEDCFWADGLSYTSLAFTTPDVITAAHFCMEKSPSYLYQLIGNKLPFACHAYEKYEYEDFWREYIYP